MGFPGDSVVKKLLANAGDTRDVGLIPGSGRSPGGGNCNRLQYCCLESPMIEEPSRLQSMGSQGVRHDWATEHRDDTQRRENWHLAPVWTRERQGQSSLCPGSPPWPFLDGSSLLHKYSNSNFLFSSVENSEKVQYRTTWPASWETYMQVRKQQLELDMEQQTGCK